MASTIGSDEFINSNEHLVQTHKKIEEEKLRQELLLKRQQREKELLDLEIEAESVPDKSYINSVTLQHVEESKLLERQKFEIEDDIRKRKIPIDDYKQTLEIEHNVRMKGLDALNEQYIL